MLDTIHGIVTNPVLTLSLILISISWSSIMLVLIVRSNGRRIALQFDMLLDLRKDILALMGIIVTTETVSFDVARKTLDRDPDIKDSGRSAK